MASSPSRRRSARCPRCMRRPPTDVIGGDYIGPDGFQQIRGYPRKVGCRKLARDTGIAQRLWQVSEELTGVKYALS